MKRLIIKPVSAMLLTSTLMVGCASTDPYTPERDSGFVYNKEQSFAMNVVDGSLGFHSGLKDAELPADSDTSASGLDYAVDGIIGSAFGGGIGGAVLSMLGTNSSNAPLNYGYGIAYIAVDSFEKVDIDKARLSLTNLYSLGAAKNYDLQLIKVHTLNSINIYTYHGKECINRAAYYQRKADVLEITDPLDCVGSGHDIPKFVAKTNVTPNGTKGQFVVYGLPSVGALSSFTSAITIPSISEMGEFYYLEPASHRNRIPFVYFNERAHLFVKPIGEVQTSISLDSLRKLSPKLFEYK